ncbi:YbaB/EbfC family nucleoid-associated protein [Segniliparus rugosus]|uniref:Uncharacterized protein n=1 Tax=Segniliparus rugosus (strain ATCC BAA-974 / DSM 45345 / CCUG 50838 / CIP 108380 / JCM 13579 / CDC 945) TaxID=679197 RepID=U1N9E3_SEGRC|nr:YbaB/EbfC family nucleoid-associated protein [Segniliparus rugosus]ERG69413.1 hypothetical protein HMPREF9336_04109 [Segniliparus rugosus ATCC BAA-974]
MPPDHWDSNSRQYGHHEDEDEEEWTPYAKPDAEAFRAPNVQAAGHREQHLTLDGDSGEAPLTSVSEQRPRQLDSWEAVEDLFEAGGEQVKKALSKQEALERDLKSLKFHGRSRDGHVLSTVDGLGEVLELVFAEAPISQWSEEGIAGNYWYDLGNSVVESVEKARHDAGIASDKLTFERFPGLFSAEDFPWVNESHRNNSDERRT